MNDPTSDVKDATLNSTSPTFSLFHLLTLVTSCCVMFGVQEAAPITPGTPNPEAPTWKWLFRLSEVFAGMICITVLVVVIRQWFRTKCFVHCPGYLLGLVAGIATLLDIFGDYFFSFDYRGLNLPTGFSFDDAQRWVSRWQLFQVISSVLVALIAIPGVFKYRTWWKLTLAAMITFLALNVAVCWTRARHAIFSGNPTDYEMLASVSNAAQYAYVAFLGMLCASVIIDLFTHSKNLKDWIHWLGVCAIVVFYLLPGIVLHFASRYLGPAELFTFEAK